MPARLDTSDHDAPHTYRIVVRGRLGLSWTGRLAGMRIKRETRDGSPIAVLQGEMRDQSELLGVLNTLHELHLPLVGVELVY
jgi:hypothetical protein